MQFSDKIYNAKPGYTYDDFLLVPNASWIEAKDVETKVNLTKDIQLNIPIMIDYAHSEESMRNYRCSLRNFHSAIL